VKISCVIVSYNNGKLLEEAINSVVRQARPVEELIVADDGSADGSRQLIEAMSHKHPNIKPILRDRNLGVSANRDLAIREARGDFITCLDGDDYFLPGKIEAEARAVDRRFDVIAFSDVRWVDKTNNRFRTGIVADFAGLGPSDRVRWLLTRTRQAPAAMLMPKEAHLRIGGYNHALRTYEDWDYILRLAAQPFRWAYSGAEGLAAHPAGGLSRQPSLEHMRDELRVLRMNQAIARRHAGLPSLLAVASRIVAFRVKWWMLWSYWRKRGWVD
jgi:glycosyltransferase involved in cell wall biosynthesis